MPVLSLMRRSTHMQFAVMLSALTAIVIAARPGLGLVAALPVVAMAGLFTGQRATAFEVALPIPARRILLARVGAGLALVAFPLLAWLVAGLVRGGEADAYARYTGPAGVLEMFAIGAFGVVLPHAIRPGIIGVSPGIVMLPVVSAGLLSQRAILSMPSLAVAAALLGACAAAFAFTWWRMPPSYQLAPRAAGRAARLHRAGLASVDAGGTVAADVRWWRPVLSSVWSYWLVSGFVLVGFAGAAGSWTFYLAILTVPHLEATRGRLGWLHALPVSRHVQLLARMAPLLVPLAGVLLFSQAAAKQLMRLDRNQLTAGAPHRYSDVHHFDDRTSVSLQFWQRAPGGNPPLLQAPWGETSVADTIRVAGLTFYNPYSAQTGASPRFVEWQFTRATTAVFGRAIPLAEYEAEGFVAPPRTTWGPRVMLFGGALALVFVLLLAWLAELGRWHVVSRHHRWAAVAPHFQNIALFGIAALHLYYTSRHGTEIVEALGGMAALRLANVVPSTPVAAALSIMAVGATYALVYWQGNRSEWATAPVAASRPGANR